MWAERPVWISRIARPYFFVQAIKEPEWRQGDLLPLSCPAGSSLWSWPSATQYWTRCRRYSTTLGKLEHARDNIGYSDSSPVATSHQQDGFRGRYQESGGGDFAAALRSRRDPPKLFQDSPRLPVWTSNLSDSCSSSLVTVRCADSEGQEARRRL